MTCAASSKHVVGGRFRVRVEATNVDPSQAPLATCTYVRKVALRVTGMELKRPEVVEGFNCADFVLKSKPAKFAYRCGFEGDETATEIFIGFTVAYVKEAIPRRPADRVDRGR